MSGSRRPSTCSQKRCSAIIVAFDSSSPTHQPPGCCRSSRRLVAASTALSRRVSSLVAVIRPSRPRCRSAPPPPSSRASPRPSHAPARYVFGREVSIGHLRLRVPGRAANVARGSRETRDQTSSAGPSRSRERLGHRLDEALAADLEQVGDAARDDRQVLAAAGGSWPVRAPRSNTQCAGESSSAASRCWRIGRSKSRWTLTIGESSSAGASRPRSARRLRWRHGDDHRVGIEVVEALDPRVEADAVAERAAGRRAVHLAERLDRQEQIGRARAGEERRLDGEDPVVGARLAGRQVERRPDEDVPEAVDLLAGCPAHRARPRRSVRDRLHGLTPLAQAPRERSGPREASGRCE